MKHGIITIRNVFVYACQDEIHEVILGLNIIDHLGANPYTVGDIRFLKPIDKREILTLLKFYV
jgi:hypothetical protein